MCCDHWITIQVSLTHCPSFHGWASRCPVLICVCVYGFIHLDYWVGFLSFCYLSILSACLLYTCIFRGLVRNPNSIFHTYMYIHVFINAAG